MATTATRRRKPDSGNGASAQRRRATPPSGNGHGGTPRTPIAQAKKAAAAKGTKRVATKATGKTAKKAATAKGTKRVATKAVGKTAKKALTPSGTGSHLARSLVSMGLKRALRTGAATARVAALRMVEEGREALQRTMTPRVPVQRSVDVAVPLRVAWQEWMKLDVLPEGAHRVHEIERDGNELHGRIDAPGQPEWRAEILDERDQDSFAWRSIQGSDCAGLITFHRLADKLTRLELDLDALPTSAAEAVALNTPLAPRRAEIELRRFKAHLEFINPDDYMPDDGPDDNE